MKTAVIYARYSSERQTEQSIEGQLRVCNDYAERNNIRIIDTYIDRAMTGTNDNRTDFQKLLKDSNKKAWDYVIVYKLDRFSRNKYEMAMHKKTLRDNGIKLISAMENIPDTPEGIILESLLEGMAEYYSAELSQKVRRGMNETRQKGNFTGGLVPYGFKKDGKKVVINKDEAEIVKRLYTEFAAGKLVTDILQEFKEQGILYRGKNFGRNTLYNFLKTERYVGRYTFNGEVYTNIYPQIIPDDLFEFVKNKIESNKYGKHKPQIIYLLKNKLKCGYCNSIVNSDSGTSKSGKVIRYYKCVGKRKNKECLLKPIRKELIEDLVVNAILSVLETNDMIQNIAKLVIEKHNKKIESNTILNLLKKEKDVIDGKINNILKAMENGIITSSTKKHLEELESQQREIEEKIVVECAKEKLQITENDIIKFIKVAINKKPQQMINLLVDEVKLYNDKIEIYFKYNKITSKDDEDKQEIYNKTESILVYNNLQQVDMNVKILI